jgi:hypothetical protein
MGTIRGWPARNEQGASPQSEPSAFGWGDDYCEVARVRVLTTFEYGELPTLL